MPADAPRLRGLAPLVLLSAVVVLVVSGLARGAWWPNLHNGLLALAFAGVGTYVLAQRPGHRAGSLFLATGVVEAVLFLGRQVAHAPGGTDPTWWAWFGVWPTAAALGLTTVSVLLFPDGRLTSPRWRPVLVGVVVLAAACSLTSAVWPVEYASAGLDVAHPLNPSTPAAVDAAWSALAHPIYAVLQVLWVVAVVQRWRSADTLARQQLAWVVLAAAASAVALAVGLVVTGKPYAGLLAAALVPVAAGWAVVHGQQVAAYAALTWLSRRGPGPSDPAHDLAAATARGLDAPGAVLWMGTPERLGALGVWPAAPGAPAGSSSAALDLSPDHQHRPVLHDGEVIGALSVERPATDRLTRSQQRLFDDLAAQASLVLQHQGLADVLASRQRDGDLPGLSPREQQVLDLMARGLSNTAIAQELHLSIKTVEPLVSTVFRKLDLQPDGEVNRRVLAVLAYLRA